MPFKSSCSLTRADPFKSSLFFPLMGSRNKECKGFHLKLNEAIPKKAVTIQHCFNRDLIASITKLFPEPAKPLIIIKSCS